MGVGLNTGSDGVRWVRKSVTFTGAAGSGAVGDVNLFTVTGEVLVVAIVPFCTGDLTEAGATAAIGLGVVGNATLFVGSTTATTIDDGEFWVSTTPTAAGIALPAAVKDIAITANIKATVATQAVNGGSLRVDLLWLPLSADGNVVAA